MGNKSLVEKFKPLVNGYVGSSMLTNTEYPEIVLTNAQKCVEIADFHVIEFLTWLYRTDFQFRNGNLIQYDENSEYSFREVLNAYHKSSNENNS